MICKVAGTPVLFLVCTRSLVFVQHLGCTAYSEDVHFHLCRLPAVIPNLGISTICVQVTLVEIMAQCLWTGTRSWALDKIDNIWPGKFAKLTENVSVHNL